MSYYNFYTIDQIYREKQEGDLLFKDSAIVKSFVDAGVIDQAQSLDRIFLNFFSLRIYKDPVLVENEAPHLGEALNAIQLDILDCDYLYKYKYDKLLKTLSLKYNPIWNKDGEITHTSTRTPDLTTTDSGSSQVTVTHDTTVAGSNNSTTTETPDLHGSTSVAHGLSTVESPSTSQTATHSTSPYDGGGPYVESEDVTSNSGSTTTTNSGTDTTTTSTSGSTTTTVTGSDSTKTTGTDSTAGTDGNTRKETGTDVIEEKTIEQGNIGVTTTQSLITEEREIANFSILKEYCTDIANYICMSTYKTED